MHTRREFLQRAALLSGATFAMSSLTESILAAARIEPIPGSTFLDAEHIVILMQENRSFDHAFGALRGVRGFRDPRPFRLANGNPVWLQTRKDGKTFSPFRLDIKDTNITWIGGLPHSWTDQVDARAEGRYDAWLDVKKSGHKDAKDSPLTLGYFTREDIPFYYALADAFTVCDQNFCSSLTGTTANRSFLWAGTIRDTHDGTSQARVRNGETDYDAEASYKTFPEVLEDHGINWKVYQNELSIDTGFVGEEDAWLANFTDNNLEWFSQYNVRLHSSHLAYLERRQKELEDSLASLTGEKLDKAKSQLAELVEYRKRWNPAAFEALDARAKSIHRRAFTINDDDPDFRSLAKLTYDDNGTQRTMQVPKGDVLHQFRKDVEAGALPTVSWLVPPEHYSDHPGSAWYGAWFLAEAMDILTKNPEIWQKTIFILTYDENDGWFDHVQPFMAPNPNDPATGKVSEGINTAVDYVAKAQDALRTAPANARENSIGLGYRVPMVVASPWSRGGAVCSQVFDHTSTIQLAEVILSKRLGKPVRSDNISDWRRTVCGDMTSVFREPSEDRGGLPFFDRDVFLESIHKAQFKRPISGFAPLSEAEIATARQDGWSGQQEPGTRPACPLPYEFFVDEVAAPVGTVAVQFRVERGVGVPFNAYLIRDGIKARSYAVRPGTTVSDSFEIGEDGGQVRIEGPNGFLRELRGSAELDLKLSHKPNGDVVIDVRNASAKPQVVVLEDQSYSLPRLSLNLGAGARGSMTVASSKTAGWYDVQVSMAGSEHYSRRFAGRVETGKWTTSDPAMGRP